MASVVIAGVAGVGFFVVMAGVVIMGPFMAVALVVMHGVSVVGLFTTVASVVMAGVGVIGLLHSRGRRGHGRRERRGLLRGRGSRLPWFLAPGLESMCTVSFPGRATPEVR